MPQGTNGVQASGKGLYPKVQMGYRHVARVYNSRYKWSTGKWQSMYRQLSRGVQAGGKGLYPKPQFMYTVETPCKASFMPLYI